MPTDNTNTNGSRKDDELPLDEVERILRDEPMIDAAEVNRMLGITDDEIVAILKRRPGTTPR